MSIMKRQAITCGVIAFCLLNSSFGYSFSFDTSLLAGESRHSDLSQFLQDNNIPEGYQKLDVFVNGAWKGQYNLLFGTDKDDITIAAKDAARLGIDLKALSLADSERILLSDLVQGGAAQPDISNLSLNLSVPQAYVMRNESGYVDPSMWDKGISAITLGYNTNYYNSYTRHSSQNTDSFYSGFELGINLFGWQYRESSNFQAGSGRSSKWQNNTRYLKRSFASIKSDLLLGDFYSTGDLFDSVRMRGASLTSDMTMRPSSQHGFAPIIRGVAQTNALVKVFQNDYVVYQENVPPGAFVLDNIQPTGSAGDLQVVVQESDGTQQTFTVPFSAVPNMLKQGVYEYSLVVGQVKEHYLKQRPNLAQGSIRYGLNNLVTAYGGLTAAENYQSYLLGSGWNLPIGAVSFDITHSSAKLNYAKKRGQSYRVGYSKFVNSTATNFTLAAYRYSTSGYYSLADYLYAEDRFNDYKKRYDYGKDFDWSTVDLNTWDSIRSARPKNTFTINMNQRLSEGWGTVYLSGTQRDYWAEKDKTREYQLGYSNSIKGVNYSISASRVRNNQRKEEMRYYLSFNFPLTFFENRNYLSSNIQFNDSAYQQSSISLSGSALEDARLSYSISGTNSKGGNNMASVNANYRASMATVGASYSESSDFRQTGLSARGSVLAMPWTILTANEMGSTMAVVSAPGAKGMMVNSDKSIITNKQGLALVPYASPYRTNAIILSETNESEGADLVGNIENYVPYKGAVTLVNFETDQRQKYIIKAVKEDGSPLPFGAEVQDEKGSTVGYVGQASKLYVKSEHTNYLIVKIDETGCTLLFRTGSNICY